MWFLWLQGETKTAPEKAVEALPANESVPPQAEAPQSGEFTDSNLAFNASNPLPQVVIPPVVNGEGNLAPQLDAQNLAAAQVWVTTNNFYSGLIFHALLNLVWRAKRVSMFSVPVALPLIDFDTLSPHLRIVDIH